MWGLLATLHYQITANENLADKPYSCLVLLAKLEDLLRSVDSRIIVLGVFDPFPPLSTLKYGTPLVVLGYCRAKQIFPYI